MRQVKGLLKKINHNKVLHYVFSRYITYFIQFINSLFIAVYLGPFYLGIWGFINLIIQYFTQLNFGIAHSVNAIVSIHKNKDEYVIKIVGTALSMLILLSFIFALFSIVTYFFDLRLGDKYNFTRYVPFVLVIAVLGNFNSLLSNVFRIYGKIFEIAFNQSIFPILILILIFIFKGENLLWALVTTNCISLFLSLFMFLLKSPIKLKPIFNWRLAKTIQRKGLYLFIYNTSFYLIIISTRSFVSGYYEVSEFGYFTFAFSLANTIFLLFESFSFLIFPKLLNRFAKSSNEKISLLLDMVRNAYITMSHALIHLAVFLFPIFLQLFLPKYEPATDAFKMIALTIVLYTNSFGYQGLLIAKGEEKRLGKLSLFALFINIIIAFVLVILVKVNYSLVVISTMITYLFYVFLIGRFGRKKLNMETTFADVLKDVYPIRLFLPYFISLGLIIFSIPYIYFIIPFVLFLLLNYKILLSIKDVAKNIIENPNFVNI